MKQLELPSTDRLRECFDLRSDGALIWKHRPGSHFDGRPAVTLMWNAKFAGKIAGRPSGNGSLQVGVFGGRYYNHRVVYCLANDTSISCDAFIDHIDGNNRNNDPSNLRLADRSQNGANRGSNKNNTSGAKGVYIDKRTGSISARICVNRKQLHIGTFASIPDAADAYAERAAYHFGEFARTK